MFARFQAVSSQQWRGVGKRYEDTRSHDELLVSVLISSVGSLVHDESLVSVLISSVGSLVRHDKPDIIITSRNSTGQAVTRRGGES